MHVCFIPITEYDPNPLLFLTKRRRTVSVSETSEPRKSVSTDVIAPTQSQQKDKEKPKRGPGRPPKVDRLMSNESVGEEDVFIEERKKSTESKVNKRDDENNDDDDNVESEWNKLGISVSTSSRAKVTTTSRTREVIVTLAREDGVSLIKPLSDDKFLALYKLRANLVKSCHCVVKG